MSVEVRLENEIAWVSLNRPELRNAFDPVMIQKLTQTFADLKTKKIRLAVLQGQGKVFCAGADLSWMKQMVQYSFQQNQKDAEVLYAMFDEIATSPFPVLGKVHGAAFGGALGLLAVCDEVIATDSTQFCFSEVKLGISPAVISAFLIRKVSAAWLTPWMLSARIFSAAEALQGGLVHAVASNQEQLDQMVQERLQNYRQVGMEAVRATKKLLMQLPSESMEDQKQHVCQVIAERRVSAEGQEGLQSFLEKRTPSWRPE